MLFNANTLQTLPNEDIAGSRGFYNLGPLFLFYRKELNIFSTLEYIYEQSNT